MGYRINLLNLKGGGEFESLARNLSATLLCLKNSIIVYKADPTK